MIVSIWINYSKNIMLTQKKAHSQDGVMKIVEKYYRQGYKEFTVNGVYYGI